MRQFYQQKIRTPLGPMLATADEEKLIRLDYGSFSDKGELHEAHIRKFLDDDPHFSEEKIGVLQETEKQLAEYFHENRQIFSLPYEFHGTTFQKKVWETLAENVPFGHTCSYKELAASAGNEKAIRAIGGAMNKNPFSIIVPCHRVVGHNGKLTGYGGGVDKKVYLLDMETTRM
ncbi:methylated-DNA--[protein]-cysteine S-methyltransferase [Salimicrobium halophilum]|uniref:Methylated-DNA--protein-cysteine methyltransferase n=1 Tax=Salimicrobium halophilum TaxID=86666 RepID=A0A1G8TKX7_9BACI|nr:methylated-DNA--[protein]-cysteine S-methyltransferase [Salimicrobium halophilum]SDJ41320.1 methylated-DNA-[protein]-cysteine S-methyltransferase [Salimicrobium halophilum]